MGVENGSQSIPWGGERRRHLRSDAEVGLLQGEEAMDRIDDAVRKLIEVRGPVGTPDVVTALASQVASLLAASAGPDGDPEALFDTMIRAQIDMVRRMNAIEKERADG
ncbi:hypothetical protein G3I61_05940 [Streptomyces diastaticus]|nr:hypothetical protein [Streptomyces diastaticus]